MLFFFQFVIHLFVLKNFQAFTVECQENQVHIKTLQTLSNQLTRQTIARDTADALQSRWQAVHATVSQRASKLDRLVALWNEMEETAKHMEEWLKKPEFAVLLRPMPAPATLTEEQLQKQLVELQVCF